MNIKKLFLFLFISINLYSFEVPDYHFIKDYTYSSLVLSPQPGLFKSEELEISAFSEEGVIYYFLDNGIEGNEPVLYEEKLYLTGEVGFIKDFIINFIVIKANGTVEDYSVKYSLDNTKEDLSQVNAHKDSDSFSFTVTHDNNTFKLETGTNVKILYSSNNDIRLGDSLYNENTIVLNGAENTNSRFILSGLTKSMKHNYIYYDYFDINLEKPMPPEIGTMLWGQKYTQDMELSIVNPNKNGKIMYWLKEWKTSDIMRSHPNDRNNASWLTYFNPIKIDNTLQNSVFSISTFIRSDNGIDSDIVGPFYFKIDEDGTKLEQIFNKKLKIQTKNNTTVLINGLEIENKYILSSSDKLSLQFNGNQNDDTFIFEYSSLNTFGKSNKLPANGNYIFVPNNDDEYEFTFKYSDGRLIAGVLFGRKLDVIPKPVKYKSNLITFYSENILDFYMPVNKKFKYAVSNNKNEDIIVNSNSTQLESSLLFSEIDKKEVLYRLRIADVTGDRIINDIYIDVVVDKKESALNEITIKDFNPNMVYNEKIKVIVENNLINEELYYRLNTTDMWYKYDNNLILNPVSSLLSSITIYFKSIGKNGIETLFEKGFTYNFDKRAIFVDYTFESNDGNGTEKFPVKNISKALHLAKLRGLKIINLVSKDNYITNMINIVSDIIIQPYNESNYAIMIFENKSIQKKQNSWFSSKGLYSVDFRNLNIMVKSGRLFASTQNSKFNFYNSDINVDSQENFCLINGSNSQFGMSNTIINVNSSYNFTMVSLNNSEIILKKISGSIIADTINFLTIENDSKLIIDDFSFKFVGNTDNRILNAKKSFVSIQKSQIIINTDNGTIIPFSFIDSTFEILKNTITSTTIGTVGSIMYDIHNSNGNFLYCQTFIEGGNDVIGINSSLSTFTINNSLIESNNVSDFSYQIRATDSNITMKSSILKNSKSDTGIGVLISDSSFTGINNSFFSYDITGKTYSFWIANSLLTTVNSLYLIDNNLKSLKSFIFLKDADYLKFKPVWISNIVSTTVMTIENINNSIHKSLVNDFSESNVFFNLNELFDLQSKYYFIPINKDQIGDIGITSFESEIKIPETDFFGKSRSNNDIIDVGAVQFSDEERILN
ncbi:MAG: hypothetical protein A2015_09265 [Spirochaetes bacterium GWF1_31_7]|nr:MAG: hypothetical protein A2Y30_08955 [Spirochaetes bacterium GWE1_32_154]OHD45683.1 MAG: hypothetical protein A2Y29_10180 [Spirochaetes bacterium GWE2_31_10]OHD47677.1 MAG: hypothetical protein A2015_09265 [Spirochaetes bacterium GWF1_31_7]HBD94779.1 hypothetical protein [Spirochaetia bacterium]